jgi:hypothetical protein
MRAPTPRERLTGALSGAYEALQTQPLVRLLGAIREQMDQGFRGTLGPEWQIGAMPSGPTGFPGRLGRPASARTTPIAGTTLDELLAAGEAQYPASRTIQVIEPGTGRVIDPAREAALARARILAGR